MASLANVPQQPPYFTHAALSAAKQPISPNPKGLKLLFWPLNADTPAALETSGLDPERQEAALAGCSLRELTEQNGEPILVPLAGSL